MPEIAYINKTFMPIANASVPINDRGYMFADGIYEVVVSDEDRIFLLDEHLERLEKSAGAISLTLPLTREEMAQTIKSGIKQAGFPKSMVYIQITRGVESRRHNYSEKIKPNLIMTFRPKPEYASDLFVRGVAVMTVPEIRWSRCDIKSIALLPNVMMKQKAVSAGFQEALFVTDADIINECTTANIFLIKNEILYTPPADHNILNGITRSYILRQAKCRKLEYVEKKCSLNDLYQSDEVFITSSTINLMPVVKIDNQTIGNGKPGPLSQTISNFF